MGASNVLHLKRGGDKEEQMQLWPDPAVPRQANKWCSNIDPIIYKNDLPLNSKVGEIGKFPPSLLKKLEASRKSFRLFQSQLSVADILFACSGVFRERKLFELLLVW